MPTADTRTLIQLLRLAADWTLATDHVNKLEACNMFRARADYLEGLLAKAKAKADKGSIWQSNKLDAMNAMNDPPSATPEAPTPGEYVPPQCRHPSLADNGICHTCGAQFAPPNREFPVTPAAAPTGEQGAAPFCRPCWLWCGTTCASGHPERQHWCSAACAQAGRPLNPEVKP